MFIRNNKSLPPNIVWIEEDKAKGILEFFPEISRRCISNGNAEIAFVDSKELRNKLKELNVK